MQMFYSFLQTACHFIHSLSVKMTKRLYRGSAVLISTLAVVTVISFCSSSYAGAGKNVAFAHQKRGGISAGSSEEDSPDEEGPAGSEDSSGLVYILCSAHTVSNEAGRYRIGDILEDSIRKDMDREEVFRSAVEEEVRKQVEQTAAEAEKKARKKRAVILYDDYDLECLLRIVEAEAGGQDERGRILVANVIINRVKDREFPDNLYDVIYEPGQFQPVASGVIDRVSVSDLTRQCVYRALEGEDYSGGSLYFMNRRGSTNENKKWFDRRLTFVMAHGGHEFFR